MSSECTMIPLVKIERPLYDLEGMHQVLDYHQPEEKLCSNLNCDCKLDKFLLNSIPVFKWLPKYKWRQDFLCDLISGFTVAIMHIPQGMAYALLGNVPPIVGIYMAFFPVLVYFLLGTSKHNSMGTFAIVCLMTGKVVLEQTHGDASINLTTQNTTSKIEQYTPMEVASTVTFVVAIFQLLMYVFRLGIVSTLLSGTLVNGFTTGAAIHVLISQLKDLIGVSIPKHKGAFSAINTLVSIFKEITNLNTTALIISAVTISACVINNELIKPRISKISSFPIPIELLVVVTGTLVSNNWNFNEVFDVKIIGHIPSGIPAPTLPKFSLLQDIVFDGLIIAIVAYTIALSMGLIFAQKLHYEVDANQELLAQGAGNLMGSFFNCMPFSASLSRSLIQESVGGKSQLASLISCILLLFVLLWIGPFFESLPNSVLASVIVVALKGMLMQMTSIVRFWKLSKLDGIVWIITFLTTVIINVDVGLLAGVIVSLIIVLVLGMKPYTCLLGSLPKTDLYVDISRYNKVSEVPNTKIFHYCGGINFATRNYFKSELYRVVKMDPQKQFRRRQKQMKRNKLHGLENNGFETSVYQLENKISNNNLTNDLKFIIIDFSALSYLDPSAIITLQSVVDDFHKIDIAVSFAACSDPVYETMLKCNFFKQEYCFQIFPTIHDAVQSILETTDITSL